MRDIMDGFHSDYQDTRRFRREISYDLHTMLEFVLTGEEPSCFQDENLRWGIWKDEKLLASNLNGITGNLMGHQEPGYNFYLEYRDGKVQIWKDGAEVDVYGDEVYRDRWEQWELPGYRNLDTELFVGGGWTDSGQGVDLSSITGAATPMATAVPEEPGGEEPADGSGKPWDGVTIRLAAAETPVDFYGPNTNRIYQVAETLRYKRLAVCIVGGCFLLGVALVVWSLLWRRWMALTFRAAGRLTGKIWLEIKLLLLALLVGPLMVSLSYIADPIFLVFAIGLCWILVFYLNDFLCNRGRLCRVSFCGWLAGKLRGDGLDLPLQRRAMRSGVVHLMAVVILALGAAAFDLELFLSAWRSGSIRIWVPFLIGLVGLVLLGIVFLHWKEERAMIEDLGALSDQIEAVRRKQQGTMLAAERPLAGLSQAVADIDSGLQQAVEERLRSERMKVELITNVSHDLKTPLTSILSYAALLEEEELPDHVRDYVTILNDKAQRLKNMVQEVFDVSKAASGNLNLHWEELDLAKLLRQTLADQAEPIAASGLDLRTRLPAEPVLIRADGDRLYRVFQNLIQNVLQYSLEGSRAYLTLETNGESGRVCVQNISREELSREKDFTERFVRGDESRSDGGSGLGLAIAKSFTEACGGTFRLRTDADLFTVEVEFPCVQPSLPEGTESV
ncbi:sensor histidine kinase [Pseudoflavonifractor hominis]|uniref:histidine kinase n=1 Tax=Pseudoflavonifractor hominis TaxID=2763059 RepID=A0ABR7HPK4_9FIRM|nr:HAMP domain-containing sensor histidine kinase [Pseudoflavonifractor hominis]MBC5729356.1 HAMP domain-containing histidine kinase [Pseudoflavonifractor hominis]